MDSKNFTHAELKRRKCKLLAEIIFQTLEERIGLNSRLPELIIWDDWCAIGSSGKAGSTYREHVVPLCYLRDLSMKMFDQKKSKLEVEQLWFDNYLIAMITREEADRLNSMLDLKTSMPKNWKLGDDPCQRLWEAGIGLIKNENNKKIA